MVLFRVSEHVTNLVSVYSCSLSNMPICLGSPVLATTFLPALNTAVVSQGFNQNLPLNTQQQSSVKASPKTFLPTPSQGFTQNFLPTPTTAVILVKASVKTFLPTGFTQHLPPNTQHSCPQSRLWIIPTPSSQHPAQQPSVKALNHSNTFLPTPSIAALSQGFTQHLSLHLPQLQASSNSSETKCRLHYA